MKVYLDAYCLNRPFDDQNQDRTRLEAEAVLLILRRLETGEWNWIGSEALSFEIQQTPDFERRLRLHHMAGFAHHSVMLGEAEVERAQQLEAMGFHGLDALHLACAESGGADVFLTTDDRLLGLALRVSERLELEVRNPLGWLEEVAEE